MTGAGRGIGRATALLLSEMGADVMGVSRSEEELKTLGLDYCAIDLSSEAGCSVAFEATVELLGRVDILVCNHGIGSAHEHVVWEQSANTWEETVRINLSSPFHLAQQVLPGMVERQYGRLVFTSSTAGQTGGCSSMPTFSTP